MFDEDQSSSRKSSLDKGKQDALSQNEAVDATADEDTVNQDNDDSGNSSTESRPPRLSPSQFPPLPNPNIRRKAPPPLDPPSPVKPSPNTNASFDCSPRRTSSPRKQSSTYRGPYSPLVASDAAGLSNILDPATPVAANTNPPLTPGPYRISPEEKIPGAEVDLDGQDFLGQRQRRKGKSPTKNIERKASLQGLSLFPEKEFVWDHGKGGSGRRQGDEDDDWVVEAGGSEKEEDAGGEREETWKADDAGGEQTQERAGVENKFVKGKDGTKENDDEHA